MTRAQADLILLGIALIWGLAFIFQKTAMEDVGPFTFVASRSLIAALALAPIAVWEHRRGIAAVPIEVAPVARVVPIAFTAGLAFFAGLVLQQIGLVTATVTNTGFLTGLYVVLTPVIAFALLARRPSWIVWLAAALAFAGTWLLGGGTIGGFSTGDVLVMVSALFWSAHMLIIERSAAHGRPVAFTAMQFALVAMLSIPVAVVVEATTTAALWNALPEILYVGFLSSALTFTLLAVAMKHTPAPEAAILVSMETVFAAMFAYLLLAERLAAIGWLGAALMFAATVLVQLGPVLTRPRSRLS